MDILLLSFGSGTCAALSNKSWGAFLPPPPPPPLPIDRKIRKFSYHLEFSNNDNNNNNNNNNNEKGNCKRIKSWK